MAHAVLLEQVERRALTDRGALLTAAAINGVQNYTPIDVGEQVTAWERWLVSDPAAPQESAGGESFADRVAQFQQQVQQLDEMAGVA